MFWGVSATQRPGYSLIRLQTLSSGPVSVTIPNTKIRLSAIYHIRIYEESLFYLLRLYI